MAKTRRDWLNALREKLKHDLREAVEADPAWQNMLARRKRLVTERGFSPPTGELNRRWWDDWLDTEISDKDYERGLAVAAAGSALKVMKVLSDPDVYVPGTFAGRN